MSNLVGVTPDACRLYAGDTLCRLPGSAAGGRPWVLWGRERRRWSLGALGLQGTSAGYEQPSPTWICNRGPTATMEGGRRRARRWRERRRRWERGDFFSNIGETRGEPGRRRGAADLGEPAERLSLGQLNSWADKPIGNQPTSA